MKLIEYIPRLAGKLAEQIAEDQLRQGDYWKELPREGQERRIFEKFAEYWDGFLHGQPIPWMKIIGLAMIALVREGVLNMPGDENPWK